MLCCFFGCYVLISFMDINVVYCLFSFLCIVPISVIFFITHHYNWYSPQFISASETYKRIHTNTTIDSNTIKKQKQIKNAINNKRKSFLKFCDKKSVKEDKNDGGNTKKVRLEAVCNLLDGDDHLCVRHNYKADNIKITTTGEKSLVLVDGVVLMSVKLVRGFRGGGEGESVHQSINDTNNNETIDKVEKLPLKTANDGKVVCVESRMFFLSDKQFVVCTGIQALDRGTFYLNDVSTSIVDWWEKNNAINSDDDEEDVGGDIEKRKNHPDSLRFQCRDILMNVGGVFGNEGSVEDEGSGSGGMGGTRMGDGEVVEKLGHFNETFNFYIVDSQYYDHFLRHFKLQVLSTSNFSSSLFLVDLKVKYFFYFIFCFLKWFNFVYIR